MPNFSDNFSLYRHNSKVIEDFAYLTDDDVQDLYTAGGDASAAQMAADGSLFYVGGENPVELEAVHSSGTSTWEATALGPIDITDETQVIEGTPTGGYLRFQIRKSSSAITGVTIDIGNDSSNYGSITPSITTTTHQDIEVGLSSMAITGTPDWSDVTYIKITVTTSSGTHSVYLSALRVTKLQSNTTGGVWKEKNDIATTNSSLMFPTNKFGDDGLMFVSKDTTFQVVDSLTYTDFTLTARFKVLSTSPAICFRVQSDEQGNESGYIVRPTSTAKYEAGSFTSLGNNVGETVPVTSGDYWLRAVVIGNRIRVYESTDGISFKKIQDVEDSTFASGTVGIAAQSVGLAIHCSAFECYETKYVKFNDYSFWERNNVTTMITREEAAPALDMQTSTLANTDRDFYINKNWKSKYISVEGTIIASNRGELNREVDNMKENLAAEQGRLVIGKSTETVGEFDEKSYVANVINLDQAFQRDPENELHIDYSIIFQAVDGLARKPQENFPQHSFDEALFEKNYEFKGNANPLPVVKFTLTDATPTSGDITNIELLNISTGRMVTVQNSAAYSDGDIVSIDFENTDVTVNGNTVDYEGFIDDSFFRQGTNQLQVTIYTSDSIAVSNQVPTTSRFEDFTDQIDVQYAQSFVAPESTTYERVDLYMSQNQTTNPPGTVTIRNDNSGDPGTLVTNGTASTPETYGSGDFNRFRYYSYTFGTAPSLTATNTYWIRVDDATSSFDANNTKIAGTKDNSYSSGLLKKSFDDASTWANYLGSSNYDITFRLWKALPTGISGTMDISYEPRII